MTEKTTQPKVQTIKMDINQANTGENKTSKEIDKRINNKKKESNGSKDNSKSKEERSFEEKEIDRIIDIDPYSYGLNTGYDHKNYKTILPKNYNIPYNTNVYIDKGTYTGQYGKVVERKITITVNGDKLHRKVEVLYKVFVDEITGIIRVLSDEIQSEDD